MIGKVIEHILKASLVIITLAALVALLSNRSWAQSPDAAAILARDAAIDAHLVKAREAAGFDFTGTLARLCVAPARFPLVVRDAAPIRVALGRCRFRGRDYVLPVAGFCGFRRAITAGKPAPSVRRAATRQHAANRPS